MTTADPFDDTDREIIALLQEDSRRTLADIGQRATLSVTAVKRRIDRLCESGIIIGYTILVDHAKLGRPLEAFAELRFSGGTQAKEIAAAAVDIPEVEAIFTTAGDPDALVWLRADNLSHLKQVIDRLRRTGRVTGTKTLMVLDRWSRDRSGRTR